MILKLNKLTFPIISKQINMKIKEICLVLQKICSLATKNLISSKDIYIPNKNITLLIFQEN